ncbi:MAG: hypothetical protein AB8B72_03445 [Crocinitomicaceae bacterium]
MKFKTTIAIACVGVIIAVSCNKDYTCECEDGDGEKNYTFLNAKKSMAETDCDILNNDYSANGGSCSLK